MEIERKYLVDLRGIDIEAYPAQELEQGYLSTDPVVRVRREGDAYYLTYKSGNGLVRVEENLPLTQESYEHLLAKADGYVITKAKRIEGRIHIYPMERPWNWMCFPESSKAWSWRRSNFPRRKPRTRLRCRNGSTKRSHSTLVTSTPK